MASWKQEGLIEAPVQEVWELLLDPALAPQWNEEILEVTGAPTRVELGSTFKLTGRGPLNLKSTTVFEVERLEDLHEVRFQCQTSGFYSHWFLTEAQGDTFAELEFGVDPRPGLQGRALSAIHTKGYLRRAAEKTLDGLRGAVGRVGGNARDESKIES